MPITWPTGTLNDPFPQKPFMGLSVGYAKDTKLKFTTAKGVDKIRPKSSNPRKRQSTPIELTGAQLTVFENWFMNTLEQGVLEFEWIDFKTGQAATMKFVDAEYPEFDLVSPAPNYDTPKSDSSGEGERQRYYTAKLELEIIP